MQQLAGVLPSNERSKASVLLAKNRVEYKIAHNKLKMSYLLVEGNQTPTRPPGHTRFRCFSRPVLVVILVNTFQVELLSRRDRNDVALEGHRLSERLVPAEGVLEADPDLEQPVRAERERQAAMSIATSVASPHEVWSCVI